MLCDDIELTKASIQIGCDFSGVVEEVGSKVTKPFMKGDRVCGFCHGGRALTPHTQPLLTTHPGNEANHEDGAFGEYITAKGNIQIQVPENLSFEEAATLGVGITTVGQGLYQSLQLPLPNKPTTKKTYLLIYGGSTATGSLAIQYAKLSGLTVAVTCSPKNFDYVKSLGAGKFHTFSQCLNSFDY
jgi:NADPH:quinone reductase-like Zn-dependent oxidoreductase